MNLPLLELQLVQDTLRRGGGGVRARESVGTIDKDESRGTFRERDFVSEFLLR
jgi:hypothetical protein